MKKALKTFFGFLVILFLIAGIIAVAYYFYFKLFPEEDLNQTINLNRIVTEIPSSEEDKKKTETNDLNLIGVDTTNQNNEKTSKVIGKNKPKNLLWSRIGVIFRYSNNRMRFFSYLCVQNLTIQK